MKCGKALASGAVILSVFIVMLFLITERAVAKVVPAGEIGEKVDEYLGAYVKQGNFSGTVLIARKGKVLVRKGYGKANVELNVRNTPSTKFRLGSITKQFTAMAVMQLQERGRLNVADPLSKYIPDYPQGDRIILHHLLTHTAGVPNFTDFPEYRTQMALPSSLEKTIRLFRDKPLDFTPGEKFKYSNSGYILLSYVIEKVSGQSYESFVAENIFKPLNMKDSGYDHQETILKNRASGYVLTDDGLINAPYIDMSIPSGGGALYSTVGDMYLWDRALYTEKLAGRKSLNALFTPSKENYGYGWLIGDLPGHKIITHDGSVNGFMTHIARYVDDDACVIVLSNIVNAPMPEISKGLRAILFGEEYEMPRVRKAASIDPAIYDAYVGRYEVTPEVILAVTREKDRLFIQADQQKLGLYPESPSKFFMKMVEGEVTFVKDDQGAVTQLVIRQSGQETPARRLR